MNEEAAFEILEHTADVGLRAHAPDQVQLFVALALGMTSLMTNPEQIKPHETRQIEIEAEDKEALLVEWLNELIYLVETEGLVFREYAILKLSDTSLSAEVRGEKLDESRHELKAQIKACTYYDLLIKKEDSGWYGQVVLDV